MVLGGLALAFSRLIDNSVVVLENIFRHMEMGEDRRRGGGGGGQEVALAVLAATFTTAIVFFPVVFLYRRQQVSVHRAGARRSCCRCSRRTRGDDGGAAVLRTLHQARSRTRQRPSRRKSCVRTLRLAASTASYDRMLMHYDRAVGKRAADVPAAPCWSSWRVFVVSLALFPLLGVAFFPRTDPGQFVINVKAPTGTRLEVTNKYIAQRGEAIFARWFPKTI